MHFLSTSGQAHVMSVIDDKPAISAVVEPGDYSAYFAARNTGIDQLSLGEDHQMTDAEISARKDIEWYRIFLVPGTPEKQGLIVDRPDTGE